MATTSEDLFSRLADIENIGYESLSNFESFYLLSELKKIKKNLSNQFKYETLNEPLKDFFDVKVRFVRLLI